jgi:hypothetical protein
MAEICVECAHCGTDLEVHSEEIKWHTFVLLVKPCETCLEEVAQEMEG